MMRTLVALKLQRIRWERSLQPTVVTGKGFLSQTVTSLSSHPPSSKEVHQHDVALSSGYLVIADLSFCSQRLIGFGIRFLKLRVRKTQENTEDQQHRFLCQRRWQNFVENNGGENCERQRHCDWMELYGASQNSSVFHSH